MLISENMYLFLKDYMNWAENGGVHNEPYSTWDGACLNVLRYHKLTDREVSDIQHEFKTIFESERLDIDFPFGVKNFCSRRADNTQHKDPIRLKWIKEHIKEYETSLNKVNCGDR